MLFHIIFHWILDLFLKHNNKELDKLNAEIESAQQKENHNEHKPRKSN